MKKIRYKIRFESFSMINCVTKANTFHLHVCLAKRNTCPQISTVFGGYARARVAKEALRLAIEGSSSSDSGSALMCERGTASRWKFCIDLGQFCG